MMERVALSAGRCGSECVEYSKMNLTLLEGYGYIPSYTRTDITDDLHKLFGFRTDYQITKKQKMRNIIHQTKDKKKIL